jgi:hypothetical protein
MSHDHHPSLPGYSPDQILVDGCAECEHRSERCDHGLDNLDMGNFELAWRRAARRGQIGLSDASRAEAPLLNALWSVQVQLGRRGVPIGHIPSGTLIVPAPAAPCIDTSTGIGRCDGWPHSTCSFSAASHEV